MSGEGVTLSPRRPKAGPRQRARVSFSAQNKTPALLVGVFVLIRDLELSDPRPSHKLAVNALIFNTLAYSNRSIFERLLYNNRLIINYIAASCGCDAIVTVNLLILNAFLYNPRSKTERGLCSNALVIRYIAASGCGVEPALRVQVMDLQGHFWGENGVEGPVEGPSGVTSLRTTSRNLWDPGSKPGMRWWQARDEGPKPRMGAVWVLGEAFRERIGVGLFGKLVGMSYFCII